MTAKTQKVARKKDAKKSNYDSAWKMIIRQLFKDFLEFFFPDIYNAVDFSKEIVFLDKELNEIDPDSSQGDRVADVLVRVHLKDGSTKYICIVIHVEVQGDPRTGFMERMFIYFYRAYDKEKKEKIPVISAAILTDDNPDYRPDEYSMSLFGFELRMKIPIVKTIDYKLKEELITKLETSDNPMALVVKAQLKSHEVKHADDGKRFEVTKELIRQCYAHGYDRDYTHLILNFFDWAIRLPETLKNEIKSVIKQAEEAYKMEYVPIWERDTLKKGEEIGEKRGKKIGEKRGKEKMARETAKNLLDMGISIDQISKATGLKKEVLEKMASKSH